MRAPENHRVFVVGYAVSTALGHGLKRTWERALKGESGIRRITRFDPKEYKVCTAGEIPDFDPSSYPFLTRRELRNWHAGFVPLTMALCHDALADAGFEIKEADAGRVGAVIGSAINGCDAFESNLKALEAGGANKVSPYLLPNVCANLPAGKASMLVGFKGPLFAVESACATGNHCIAESARIIQRGDADAMLAGGIELPLLEAINCGFGNMNATFSARGGDRAVDRPELGSRPYSVDRKGFVLAEGGAVLVLASEGFALRNGLGLRAEVLGTAMTSDAHHFTQPNEDAVTRCISLCLRDAGIDAAEVDVINGHGTSTVSGDSVEVHSLRNVFGEGLARIPIVSNKSQLGHSLGAAAAIEAVLAVEGMKRGMLSPTINYIEDPESADLDFVSEGARPFEHRIVLSNSFGFGGTNCCVVFRK